MSRIDELNRRYEASASIVRNGVEILAIGDPVGAQLNLAVQRLNLALRDEPSGLWDDMLGAARALRWRRVTQPQPPNENAAVREGAEKVVQQVERLRGGMANDALLDELGNAATAVAASGSLLGEVLLRSILEIGPDVCVVVAANKPAQVGLQSWLSNHGVRVFTAGELDRGNLRADQAYVVGPPRFFNSSLVTAPVTGEICFLMPAWFRDGAVPSSALAKYAEGAIHVEARILTEGDISEPASDMPVPEVDDQFLPQPVWGTRQAGLDLEPSTDEVEARKVLLSGNLAIWLDDGDRIRTLDPAQPVGERVTYTDVDTVRTGTYLLLRQGETERGALYGAALSLLGPSAGSVDASQRTWKTKLLVRLIELGERETVRSLRKAGVRTAERARAWTAPDLIRPHSDSDFEHLLQWLDIPVQPTFGHATLLRRSLYQASADVREELESAVSAADLSVLELGGHLSLDVRTEGFRGIVATRVLAISPYTEIVARHDARVPFEDRSGQWLE